MVAGFTCVAHWTFGVQTFRPPGVRVKESVGSVWDLSSQIRARDGSRKGTGRLVFKDQVSMHLSELSVYFDIL